MIDMSKAFDLVDHTLLLEKLETYKCSPQTLSWFRSYLMDRKQVVKINTNYSKPCNIKTGVPQGSILGPLLFLVFINDLSLNITSQKCMYADDITTYVSGNSAEILEEKLQKDFDNVSDWCMENRMSISEPKTRSTIMSTKETIQKINIIGKSNNNPIQHLDENMLLGIYIDRKLKWKKQVSYVKKRVNYKLSLLRRIKKYLPTHARIMFYNFYVLPLIDYCCSVWGNCSKENQNVITKLQKKAARLILDAEFRTSSRDMFEKLHWLPFPERVKYHQAVLVYKSLNNLLPSYMQNLFTFNKNVCQYKTRSTTNNHLFIPRTHRQSLSFCGVKIWNQLNNTIRNASSVKLFKKQYIDMKMSEL